jgi:hypothetical protein
VKYNKYIKFTPKDVYQNIITSKKNRNRSGENFHKRRLTLEKIGYDVHQKYGADVYILLRRNGRVVEINLATDKHWPLSPKTMVSFSVLSLTRSNKYHLGEVLSASNSGYYYRLGF